MANEYLISKWKLWFKSLDVKHDGQIALEDVIQNEDTFAKLHHLEAERKKEVQDKLEKWWSEYIFRGKPGPIFEQEFIDMLNRDFTADKEKFVERMQHCYDTIGDIVDINREGSFSEEVFVKGFRSCGHENIALVKKLFHVYNPVDGKVPIKVIIDSWVQFATCEDSSIPDVAKAALESGA